MRIQLYTGHPTDLSTPRSLVPLTDPQVTTADPIGATVLIGDLIEHGLSRPWIPGRIPTIPNSTAAAS